MKGAIYIFLLIVVSACGPIELVPLNSLTDLQPKVVSVTPVDGMTAYDDLVVEVNLSTSIDPVTITSKSFLITALAESETDSKVLWDKALDDKLVVVEGSYEVLDENRTIRFRASKPFPPGVRCGVLVTPQLLSKEHLPLNQTPGEGPTPFFSSFFAKGDRTQTEVVGSNNAMPPSLARPTYLQLNEIFYDAVGSDTEGELFIELFGEAAKSISDYQLIFVNGGDGKIVDSIKIPKGMQTNEEGFFVIADAVTTQHGITKVSPADWVTNFDPPNGPDCVQLVDHQGKLVDVVGYGSPLVLRAENNLFCYEGSPAPDAPSGQSISRLPGAEDTHDNSKDWIINKTPTPGSVEVR